jgi:hypothetical protein
MNEKIWLYTIQTKDQDGVMAGVRESNLKKFMKKNYPGTKLTKNNFEEWILRYVVEEKKYRRKGIMSIEIKE